MKTKDRTHWVMKSIAEEAADKNSIDLWPKITARAGLRPNPTQVTNTRKLKEKLALGLVLFLLGIGVLFIVPQARAFTQTIFQHMGIAFVDTHQLGDNVSVDQAEAIQHTPPASLSLEEIRQRISFSLLVPNGLPDGLSLTNGAIREYLPVENAGSGQQVTLEYDRAEDHTPETGLLRLTANDGPISAPPLLAASREQSVTVNGLPGIYVHGAWQADGTGDPNTKLGSLLWDDAADEAYLTWTQAGVTYLMEAHKLGLGLDDLMHIAGSMSNP